MQAMHEYGLWATMEKQDVSDERLHPAPAQRAGSSPPSPASRPTCCARWPPSWSSCCATRRAVPARRTPTRSRRCWTSPARPPSPRTRCSRGCSPRRTPTTRRRPREFRRFTEGGAARRQGRGGGRDHRHPRGGRPAARARRGRPGHRRRARPSRRPRPGCESFTDLRLALATRLGVEEGDEDYWHVAARRRPARPGARHLRVGRLPPGDARREPLSLVSAS